MQGICYGLEAVGLIIGPQTTPTVMGIFVLTNPGNCSTYGVGKIVCKYVSAHRLFSFKALRPSASQCWVRR